MGPGQVASQSSFDFTSLEPAVRLIECYLFRVSASDYPTMLWTIYLASFMHPGNVNCSVVV